MMRRPEKKSLRVDHLQKECSNTEDGGKSSTSDLDAGCTADELTWGGSGSWYSTVTSDWEGAGGRWLWCEGKSLVGGGGRCDWDGRIDDGWNAGGDSNDRDRWSGA